MGKNLNSVVLLLVFLMATTEILKSEAACFNFVGECGMSPFPCTNSQCKECCVILFGSPPVCDGRVETVGRVSSCICYGTLN
ncbi:unnamed protein product [Microthlaspi erraticum]|uniref:Defensin-like protein n=1 Tax=Microthlaspi erraticum TaxID=1685480 RepID=A0A6D2L956_9BRAS|nr:unnamed protein product [Microthlaspi erraticum]